MSALSHSDIFSVSAEVRVQFREVTQAMKFNTELEGNDELWSRVEILSSKILIFFFFYI